MHHLSTHLEWTSFLESLRTRTSSTCSKFTSVRLMIKGISIRSIKHTSHTRKIQNERTLIDARAMISPRATMDLLIRGHSLEWRRTPIDIERLRASSLQWTIILYPSLSLYSRLRTNIWFLITITRTHEDWVRLRRRETRTWLLSFLRTSWRQWQRLIIIPKFIVNRIHSLSSALQTGWNLEQGSIHSLLVCLLMTSSSFRLLHVCRLAQRIISSLRRWKELCRRSDIKSLTWMEIKTSTWLSL